MREPVTTVDARFSQKDATPTPWSDTVSALESGEIFWITTVRADGRPHVTPLVAVWLDDALYFSTGDGEQKEVNLRQNDHVTLTTGRNDWESGLDVMVEGRASRVIDKGELIRAAEAWTHKWDGDSWLYQVGEDCFHHQGSDESVYVFKVVPEKVLAFSKGTFSHTSHKF
jgi:nitroimidazol reductase NimA-like FMN-containing flavoprotein (pyridoxamine 5'-phosphate oxidase superfamily)